MSKFALVSCTGRKVSVTVEITREGYTCRAGKHSITYRRGEYGIFCSEDAAGVAVMSGDL